MRYSQRGVEERRKQEVSTEGEAACDEEKQEVERMDVFGQVSLFTVNGKSIYRKRTGLLILVQYTGTKGKPSRQVMCAAWRPPGLFQ